MNPRVSPSGQPPMGAREEQRVFETAAQRRLAETRREIALQGTAWRILWSYVNDERERGGAER